MGRTLRRVPLDFAHPQGETWPGYLPPEGLTDDELDAFERTDPPAGAGYQLWETTSEGSPISPVFETLEALCAWAEDNATTFADFRATAAEWRAMLERGLTSHRFTAADGRGSNSSSAPAQPRAGRGERGGGSDGL